MDDKSEVVRSSRNGGLRQDALRAGLYLFGRHGLDVALGLIAEPLIARLVGPYSYGVWIAGQRVFLYMAVICSLGIDAYLLRKEGEVDTGEYHQAFTVLLMLGVAGAGIGLLAIPILRKWIAIEGFGALTAALIVGLPLTLSTRVPMTQLERALDYRSVAIIELVGRILFYAAALVLAFIGWGAWAILLGFWLQMIINAVMTFARARYRPRLHFETKTVKEMVGYGVGFSTSAWLYRTRDLVNPLILGHFAGAEAVGYVGLAERIVSSAGFVRNATWRLSLAVLGRVQNSRQRLAAAVNEGMQLQVMALGPWLLAVGIVLPFAVAPLFGARWIPFVEIYPFVAAGSLVAAAVTLQSSALFVINRNWLAALSNAVFVAAFVASAAVLVPRLGWLGYGWAELVAIPSYWMLHRLFTREVGGLNYRFAGAVAVAFGLGFFWQRLGWPAAIGLVLLVASPYTWRIAKSYAIQLSELRYG